VYALNALSDHAKTGGPIGDVVWLRKSAREVYIRATVFDATAAGRYAWKLIEAGKLAHLPLARATCWPRPLLTDSGLSAVGVLAEVSLTHLPPHASA
jgi:hypothetical protein